MNGFQWWRKWRGGYWVKYSNGWRKVSESTWLFAGLFDHDSENWT